MRDAYLKSGVNDVLLRNVFLGSDCDNKRMFNIHLNKMKKLSQAKGTSKCPKGYSLKKCQSAKNIVRGMLFELKRVESEIDTGAKFALKNCRKNLNFQPNNSSRYNDLNGASCAALNGLDRGASTDSLSTDR